MKMLYLCNVLNIKQQNKSINSNNKNQKENENNDDESRINRMVASSKQYEQ